MPDKNTLAIIYEEVSKDPREALRITALNCQEQHLQLDEILTRLPASTGAAPRYIPANQKQQLRSVFDFR